MGAAVLRLRDAVHRPESYSRSSRRALRTPSGCLEISWIPQPARRLRSDLPRFTPEPSCAKPAGERGARSPGPPRSLREARSDAGVRRTRARPAPPGTAAGGRGRARRAAGLRPSDVPDPQPRPHRLEGRDPRHDLGRAHRLGSRPVEPHQRRPQGDRRQRQRSDLHPHLPQARVSLRRRRDGALR